MRGHNAKLLILLTIYLTIVVALTQYHANHFSRYMHSKGAETINYTLGVLLSAVIFYLLLWAINKKLSWKGAVWGTVGVFVSSYILGLIILEKSGMVGTPRNLIVVYGYTFVTQFVIVTVAFQRERQRTDLANTRRL